ncbi:MAG TPA: peptidylprolyl isomerase [Gemmatimonadales bacterium]|nr:peptidylprolyl isomerase [Gemmatimonadales bacterium]
MRRIVLAASVLVVAGCSNLGDLFSAHADVAATAAGQELTAEALAAMMGKAKGAQMNAQTAEFIAGVWSDYTLFSQAVARNTLNTDSATVATVLWPQVAEAKVSVWYDTLASRREQIPEAVADSAFVADTARALQHILFGVQSTASPAERAEARKKAQAALAQLKAGASFEALATQLSDDPGSKQNGGWYPPAKPGSYVTAFDSAAWRLAPGQMSGLVETPYGYHIIRRPTMTESRTRVLAYLIQSASARLDSIYMDSLALKSNLTVSSDAPALMRSGLADRSGMRGSRKTLAKYTGGTLTVGEYLRWLSALPPQFSAQVKDAPDEQLNRFARALGTNQLLLRQADSAGVTLSPDQWQAMQATYLGVVDTLKMNIGLGPDVIDPSASVAEREKAAQLRVDAYFDEVFAQRARLRPLPGALGEVLRDQEGGKISQPGITRAVELAAAAAAVNGAPGAAPAGGDPNAAVRPAAGPPPISAPPAATPPAAQP